MATYKGKSVKLNNPRHKANGKVMSGAKHTASSKFLVHKKDLSATAKKAAKK